jgi:release factor glutamine methyltransferase
MSDRVALQAGLTTRAAFERVRVALRAAGFDTPELDARVLTAAALAIAPQNLLLTEQRVLDAREARTLAAFAHRRLAHEPVARIVGVRAFWHLTLAIGPSTLVPRPDTETVVETALDHMRGTRGLDTPWRIADLGTGSGAILLALLSEAPMALGLGVDRDLAALTVARTNAARHGLADRALFVQADWGASIGPSGVDLIVSNPPYVPTDEIATLAPDVVRFDPVASLDGGPDGLDAYRALLPQALRALRPGGRLFLEVGETQGSAVEALLAVHGFQPGGPSRRDLAGHVRVVVGKVT